MPGVNATLGGNGSLLIGNVTTQTTAGPQPQSFTVTSAFGLTGTASSGSNLFDAAGAASLSDVNGPMSFFRSILARQRAR